MFVTNLSLVRDDLLCRSRVELRVLDGVFAANSLCNTLQHTATHNTLNPLCEVILTIGLQRHVIRWITILHIYTGMCIYI